ncbi:response regulator transcription factor [Bacillus alkalicola]|uniref:Response regulator transcription factor n=1 Tax=Evansella alkalicola TaxID=745819 RepID=A0ABS6JY08_9BACI|nr:response regulator transcription factor [Bacillus alkalicola]
MEHSVLILDNNQDQILKMESYFKKIGFNLYSVSTSKDALKFLQTFTPAAIILDINIPTINGLDLCRELRFIQNDWTPIIIISSNDDELDSVLGLELGADDYIIKPIRYKELIARVKSIIRRGNLCCLGRQKDGDMENSEGGRLTNGNLTLEPDSFMFYLDGQPVDLTRKEYEILFYLIRNKGKVLSRYKLMCELLGDEDPADERVIDVYISRIRKKIEPSRRNPIYIKTVRNIGYMMKDISYYNKGSVNG